MLLLENVSNINKILAEAQLKLQLCDFFFLVFHCTDQLDEIQAGDHDHDLFGKISNIESKIKSNQTNIYTLLLLCRIYKFI